MTARLLIAFEPAEGALLRILGLIERRGYRIRELTLAEQPDGASLSLLLDPRDEQRRPDVLARQLGGLVDVAAVSLTPDRTMAPA